MGALLIIALSLGLLILGFIKFNTWTSDEQQDEPYENPPRHFTTWWRFNCYALLYSSALIVLYLLCVFFPEIVVNIINRFVTDPISIPDNMPKDLQPAIYGMVICVPVYAFLLRYDNPWRRWVHEQAFIPDHAKALIKNFKNNPLTFKPKINELRSILKADNKFNPQLIEDTCKYFESLAKKRSAADTFATRPALEPSSPIQDIVRAWAKMLYIKTEIDSILIGSEAIRCLKKCKNQKNGLDASCDHLGAMFTIYFALNPNSNDQTVEASKLLTSEINKTLHKTLAKAYLIACCAVLGLTKSEKNRSSLFEQLGLIASFQPPPESLPITTTVQGD